MLQGVVGPFGQNETVFKIAIMTGTPCVMPMMITMIKMGELVSVSTYSNHGQDVSL